MDSVRTERVGEQLVCVLEGAADLGHHVRVAADVQVRQVGVLQVQHVRSVVGAMLLVRQILMWRM